MFTFHKTLIPEVHAVSKSSFSLGFMQVKLTSYKGLRLNKLHYCLTKQIHYGSFTSSALLSIGHQ